MEFLKDSDNRAKHNSLNTIYINIYSPGKGVQKGIWAEVNAEINGKSRLFSFITEANKSQLCSNYKYSRRMEENKLERSAMSFRNDFIVKDYTVIQNQHLLHFLLSFYLWMFTNTYKGRESEQLSTVCQILTSSLKKGWNLQNKNILKLMLVIDFLPLTYYLLICTGETAENISLPSLIFLALSTSTNKQRSIFSLWAETLTILTTTASGLGSISFDIIYSTNS